MEDIKVPSLELNSIGYLEFSFNNIKYFILEGVLTLKGKATGFSSEYDEYMYFIERELPNERLTDGLKFAKKHYLANDLTIIK